MKKLNWKTYLVWIAGVQAVGGLSAFLTRKGRMDYMTRVVQPPLAPPPILFPIVWGTLYTLMGVSAARVWASEESPERSLGLTLFTAQLAMNFCWSFLFFNRQIFGFALLWLIVMWGLILAMTVTFFKVDRPAGWMQIPYLLWVAFAIYLNYGVWRLN